MYPVTHDVQVVGPEHPLHGLTHGIQADEPS